MPKLDKQLAELVQPECRITELNLAERTLNQEQTFAVAVMVAHNSSLRKLDYRRNRPDVKGVQVSVTACLDLSVICRAHVVQLVATSSCCKTSITHFLSAGQAWFICCQLGCLPDDMVARAFNVNLVRILVVSAGLCQARSTVYTLALTCHAPCYWYQPGTAPS